MFYVPRAAPPAALCPARVRSYVEAESRAKRAQSYEGMLEISIPEFRVEDMDAFGLVQSLRVGQTELVRLLLDAAGFLVVR